MDSSFHLYTRALSRRDLEISTRDRYSQILAAYQVWLNGTAPATETALDYLAELRGRGYQATSVQLYYHVIRQFHDFLGQKVTLKLKKARRLPRYHPAADIERILAQAERGLDHWTHNPARRKRNYAMRRQNCWRYSSGSLRRSYWR